MKNYQNDKLKTFFAPRTHVFIRCIFTTVGFVHKNGFKDLISVCILVGNKCTPEVSLTKSDNNLLFWTSLMASCLAAVHLHRRINVSAIIAQNHLNHI